jgi:hypothetical protein
MGTIRYQYAATMNGITTNEQRGGGHHRAERRRSVTGTKHTFLIQIEPKGKNALHMFFKSYFLSAFGQADRLIPSTTRLIAQIVTDRTRFYYPVYRRSISFLLIHSNSRLRPTSTSTSTKTRPTTHSSWCWAARLGSASLFLALVK